MHTVQQTIPRQKTGTRGREEKITQLSPTDIFHYSPRNIPSVTCQSSLSKGQEKREEKQKCILKQARPRMSTCMYFISRTRIMGYGNTDCALSNAMTMTEVWLKKGNSHAKLKLQGEREESTSVQKNECENLSTNQRVDWVQVLFCLSTLCGSDTRVKFDWEQKGRHGSDAYECRNKFIDRSRAEPWLWLGEARGKGAGWHRDE